MFRRQVSQFALPVMCALVLTPFWLFILYVEWGLLDVDFALATEVFNKWPWIQGSITLSVLTFLLPFFAVWASRGDKNELEGMIAAYGLGYLWFPLLMIYPGTKELGVLSDDKGMWAMLPICLIHYFCARQISRQILRST